MKQFFFFLLAWCGYAGHLSAQEAFRHLATAENTQGHITTLNRVGLNDNPNAMVFVMPDYNRSGGDYTGNACVQYDVEKGRWAIVSQNELDKINPNMLFNVLFVSKETDKIFVHECVPDNTAGSGGTFPNATIINHSATSNNPNALLLVTQRKTAKPNNNAQTVSYGGGRWYISNAAIDVPDAYVPERNMPIGAAFNVMAIDRGQVPSFPNALGFMHTATPENLRAVNQTYLVNPAYTHSPDALIFATNNWGWGFSTTPGQTSGPDNGSPVAIWFNPNFTNGTAIWNTKAGVNIKERTKFNIVIIPASNSSQVMGLNYQAVLRNASFAPIGNQSGQATISIVDTAGTELYRETHTIATDQLGLFNLVIGRGNAVRGNFATTDWGSGGRFVKISVSVGGTTYNFPQTELQAVAYAKVAERSLQPGPAGPSGATGPKGDKGDKGDIGAIGATGSQGATGPKGDKGDKGDIGAVGATGSQGATGPKGDKGDKGDTGEAGATGPQGFAGPAGLPGPQGTAGVSGPKGDKGDAGDSHWNIRNDYISPVDITKNIRLGQSNNWSTAVLEVANQGNGLTASIFAGANNSSGRAIYGLNLGGTAIYGHSQSFGSGVSGFSKDGIGVSGTTDNPNSSGGYFTNNGNGNALEAIGNVRIRNRFGTPGTVFSYDGDNLLIRNRQPGRLVLTSGHEFSVQNLNSIVIGPSRDMVGINIIDPVANLHVDQGGYSLTSFKLTGSSTGTTVNDGASITITNTGATEIMRIINHENGPIQFVSANNTIELLGTTFAPVRDNSTDLGRSNTRWRNIWATNGTIQTSDARLKTDIRTLAYGLAEVMKMKPVAYRWAGTADKSTPKLGFLAQDMESIAPEVVVHETQTDGSDAYGMKYAELIPVLTKAIQEQQALIEKQQKQINDLQKRVEAMEKR